MVMKMIGLLLSTSLFVIAASFHPAPSAIVPFRGVTHGKSSTTLFSETRRRKKRNKYGKFSKADKRTMDPLEELIQESYEQMAQLKRDLKKSAEPVKVDPNEKRVRNEIQFPELRTIDPYDPTTYGYTELGTITGAHGVRGELKITAVTDFAKERLCRSGVRHLKAPYKRAPRRIKLVSGRRRINDEYLISLEGIRDRDSASKLRGFTLYAREEERPQDMDEGEYMVNDLVGLKIFLIDTFRSDDETEDLGGTLVGTVAGIVLAEEMCSIPGLGQDYLEVSIANRKKELVLIPFVHEIVPEVDVQGGGIYIDPPSGLLDLTYVREEKVRIKGFLPPARDDYVEQ